MQSEDFDKRIRDAADNHHPAYNEKAWSKMEDMLNTHLPRQKKDRRRFFFLLPILLLGSGLWIYLAQQRQETNIVGQPGSKATVENKQTTKQSTVGETTTSVPATTIPGANKTNSSTQNESPLVNSQGLQTEQDWLVKTTTAPKAKRVKQAAPISTDNTKVSGLQTEVSTEVSTASTGRKPVKNEGEQKIIPAPVEAIPLAVAPVEKSSGIPGNPPASTTPATVTVEQAKVAAPAAVENTVLQQEKESPKKPAVKKGSANGLSISFSAGPDVSSVGLGEWGKVQGVYGIGVAYTFAERFTVRTGFYTANKVYTAEPSDYKPSSPLPNYTYLDKVDADCKVYEIPLTLAYRFGKSQKHTWFGAAGLSTYLMKEEDYDYLYKYPNNTTYTHRTSYYSENKNLFSVVSLSGGYTRTLSSTFSLSAEPYLKIPLTGVGNGNVQLNSAGVLFTISAKLTGKKNR